MDTAHLRDLLHITLDILAQSTGLSEPWASLSDLAGKLSVIALLLIIGVTGAKEKPLWYFGATYRALETDRNLWRALALKGLGQSTAATDLVQKALDLAQGKGQDG